MTSEDNDGLHADPQVSRQTNNDTMNSSKVTLIRSAGVVIALLAVVVCSYLLFKLFEDSIDILTINELEQLTSSEPTIVAPKTIKQPTVQIGETAKPKANQPTPLPLPNLNDSDKEIQQAASKLTPALKWVDWITTEEAVRKFVMVIDNLAQGKIAKKHLPIPKPEHKLKHSGDGIKTFLDPAGFERYTPYISLFESVDNDMASVLYQRYLPLMEQAFGELGYPNRNFHDTLIQAFDVLLNVPIIEEDIELVRPSVLYKFAYPILENSPAAHKQLIRMGPSNTRRLQKKIQQLKTALSALKPSYLSP